MVGITIRGAITSGRKPLLVVGLSMKAICAPRKEQEARAPPRPCRSVPTIFGPSHRKSLPTLIPVERVWCAWTHPSLQGKARARKGRENLERVLRIPHNFLIEAGSSNQEGAGGKQVFSPKIGPTDRVLMIWKWKVGKAPFPESRQRPGCRVSGGE